MCPNFCAPCHYAFPKQNPPTHSVLENLWDILVLGCSAWVYKDWPTCWRALRVNCVLLYAPVILQLYVWRWTIALEPLCRLWWDPWESSTRLLRCKQSYEGLCLVSGQTQFDLNSSWECFCWAGMFCCIHVPCWVALYFTVRLLWIPTREPAISTKVLLSHPHHLYQGNSVSTAALQWLVQWSNLFVPWQVFSSWSRGAMNGLLSLWHSTRQQVSFCLPPD